MGMECKTALKRLQLLAAEMKDPDVILSKLEDHFVSIRNILYERCVFLNSEQHPYEILDQFLIKLRQLACHFGTVKNEIVRVRFVLGC